MSNKMNLPWVVFPINRSRASILDERGAYIVENVFTDTAAHIVKCANAHEGLVRALQNLADLHESNMAEIGLAPIHSVTLSLARAALAKAQGEQK